MRTRFLTFAILLAAGAPFNWLILQTSPPAAIIFGLALLLLAVSSALGIRPRPRRPASETPKNGLPPHAVALRQTRAMTRAEDGEIRGLPGGPA